MKKSTKKIWDRTNKLIPGISNIIDPIKALGLNKKEEGFVELASSVYLAHEKSHEKESGKRIPFSKKKQDTTVENQKYRCDKCRKKAKFFEFHHRDGNRSNNDLSNCQALCLDCHREIHAKKTKKKS